MCNLVLKPLIERFKKQDMKSFPLIYENFKKLIGLYASRLIYEDGVSDLTLFLIELLYGLDLSRFDDDESFGLKKYIAVSLRNQYIALSVKRDTYTNNTLPLYDDSVSNTYNVDDLILVVDALNDLNNKQKSVLVYKYIYGYSDFEIANALGISRQAVNGLKNRALSVLKHFITE